jgi:hypothetical protein
MREPRLVGPTKALSAEDAAVWRDPSSGPSDYSLPVTSITKVASCFITIYHSGPLEKADVQQLSCLAEQREMSPESK